MSEEMARERSLEWVPEQIEVKVKRLSEMLGKTVPAPFYATEGAAGMDLAACINEPVTIPPRGRIAIPTGIAIQLPSRGLVGLVFPRSGLAARHGISMANAVGVIDSDYTGEVICPVQNLGDADFTIHPGDRIAQLVFVPVVSARLRFVDQLEETRRGSGGFGSTGLGAAKEDLASKDKIPDL
ncbi:MAG: dUTP diphosphatase [Syntrophothermus sp.]